MGACCSSEDPIVELLKTTDFSELKRYTLCGTKKWVKVERCIDGDTIEVVHFENGLARKDALRLYGIDSPEMHPRRVLPLRDLEKEAAVKVQQVLANLLAEVDNIVWVDFKKEEKYGRLLGSLVIKDIKQKKPERDVQQWLVEQKLVKPYFGKEKTEWTREELEHIVGWKL
jgi:endonuclease YncB( thermonuclease family)